MNRSSKEQSIESLAKRLYAQALTANNPSPASTAVMHTRTFLAGIIENSPEVIPAFQRGVVLVHHTLDISPENFEARANSHSWTEDQRALVREMLDLVKCEVIC